MILFWFSYFSNPLRLFFSFLYKPPVPIAIIPLAQSFLLLLSSPIIANYLSKLVIRYNHFPDYYEFYTFQILKAFVFSLNNQFNLIRVHFFYAFYYLCNQIYQTLSIYSYLIIHKP